MAIHSTTCMLVTLFVYSGHSLFSCACVYLCINTTHTCRPLSLCCSDMSSGVKFCSPKALPLKVEVVKLSSCFSHSKETKGVCECKCIQLFLAELINPLSRLTPHCHSPVRTHTHTDTRKHTDTYIHSPCCVHRLEWRGVTVFPEAKKEGQAVSTARCTCPATQVTGKIQEVGNRQGSGGE